MSSEKTRQMLIDHDQVVSKRHAHFNIYPQRGAGGAAEMGRLAGSREKAPADGRAAGGTFSSTPT